MPPPTRASQTPRNKLTIIGINQIGYRTTITRLYQKLSLKVLARMSEPVLLVTDTQVPDTLNRHTLRD